MENAIELFMWSYQRIFLISVMSKAKSLFGSISEKLVPKVFLVGILVEERENRHPICLEPKDCGYEPEWFDEVKRNSEYFAILDEENHVFYSNPAFQEKSNERIKLIGLKSAIQKAVSRKDTWNKSISFCSFPVLVEGYQVFVVIQFDKDSFNSYYSLTIDTLPNDRVYLEKSLLNACVTEFLDDCCEELRKPEPGASLGFLRRESQEIIRSASKLLMSGLSVRVGHLNHNLFDDCNSISSLKYEGAEGIGRLLIASESHPNIDVVIALKKRVSLSQYRAVRKLLEMTSSDLCLLSDTEHIYGLGCNKKGYNAQWENMFEIRFLKHLTWELIHDEHVMIHVSYGQPRLPKEIINEDKFKNDVLRIFHSTNARAINRLWNLVVTATQQKHGTLVVISNNAQAEAERLQTQSTLIEPVELTSQIVQNITAIDGAVLIDSEAVCYAIGVILDGVATIKGDSSRGARYNSAVRYVESTKKDQNYQCLAVIISEDGMIDLIPNLKPQIRRNAIQSNLEKLRKMKEINEVDVKIFYEVMDWFKKHAFYLHQETCIELNRLRDEIKSLIVSQDPFIVYDDFAANEEMNDSYFLD